eukprot:c19881_g1_i2.p1 GENE.c19881_g1_i2~~c19881_g1_i2.p1  ORF type:complete len:330 (-),score=138.00 c19881_g1_i2:1333-2322(-)
MASDVEVIQEFKTLVRSKLSETTIQKLPKPTKDVVFIQSNQELQDAFRTLITNRILSAPVKCDGRGYEGFLDIMFLGSSVVGIYDSRQLLSSHIELEDIIKDIRNNQRNKKSGDHLDIWTPAYVARISPIRSVSPSATLLDVCQELKKGVHRVAVIDRDEITRIISQSFLIHSLHELMKEVESHAKAGSHPFSSLPISSLGIAPKNVWSCKSSSPAIDAFRIMSSHHLSGIAVVDESEHFIGQITVHNLNRFLENRKLDDLNNSVAEFITKNPGSSDSAENVIKLNTPVHIVFEKFADSRSHRCFIVNDENKLIGVCSLKDILMALFKD